MNHHYRETQLLIMNDQDYYNTLMNVVEDCIYMDIGKLDAPYLVIEGLGEMPTYGAWNYEAIDDLINEHYNDRLQYS